MTEAEHIFLSYRSLEADFALKLASDLKNEGVKLWMDRLDGIQVGVDWRDAIQNAINGCAAMIAVLSPDYIESEYCKKELARANSLQRPIFPVLLRPIQKENWPLVIEGLQYEDFTDWLDPARYLAHLRKLLTWLKAEVGDQVDVVPDAETRYLTTLIAELEAARGVLQYVTLSGQMDQPQDVRPRPLPIDEWGYAELVRSIRPAELGPSDSHEESEERIPLASITEAVEKHQRFVLLGEPGAGKTTTIRKLALDSARARLENPRIAPIPLLLYLSQWDQEATPVEFVQSYWTPGGDAAAMLKRGDILLYLDGLNEMGIKGPDRAQQLSEWFESADAPTHTVVTCRAGDYAGSLRLGETPTVLVQELDDTQIHQFVNNYLKDRAATFLTRVLPKDARLRASERSLTRLVHNPYMLSALMIVYEHGGDLPRNHGALFRGLVRALWRREELRGMTGSISFEQAEATFAQLAYAMIEEGHSVAVDIDYVRQYVLEERLIRIGRSASLIDLHDRNLRFFHQLVQEYFAAIELQRRGIRSKLERPSFDLGHRVSRPWDQVIINLCGLAEDPSSPVEQVLEYDPWLAVTCVKNGATISENLVAEIQRRLEGIILSQNSSIYERRSAVLALGDIGGERAVEVLLGILHDISLRSAAAKALSSIGESVIERLLKCLESNNENVQEAASQALAQIGLPSIRALLQILKDERSFVRRNAVRTLARIDMSDNRILEALKNAQVDKEQEVREAAVHGLERIRLRIKWKQARESLNLEPDLTPINVTASEIDDLTWMVVEDEPDIYEVLLAMFAIWNVEGIAFVDGTEAITWIEEVDAEQVSGKLPSLGMFDIRLPTISGTEVAARIRKSPYLNNMAIALLTAYRLSPEQEKEILEKSKADAVLYKPLPETATLIKIFRDLINARKTNVSKSP